VVGNWVKVYDATQGLHTHQTQTSSPGSSEEVNMQPDKSSDFIPHRHRRWRVGDEWEYEREDGKVISPLTYRTIKVNIPLRRAGLD
jgi:hypothetical protein